MINNLYGHWSIYQYHLSSKSTVTLVWLIILIERESIPTSGTQGNSSDWINCYMYFRHVCVRWRKTVSRNNTEHWSLTESSWKMQFAGTFHFTNIIVFKLILVSTHKYKLLKSFRVDRFYVDFRRFPANISSWQKHRLWSMHIFIRHQYKYDCAPSYTILNYTKLNFLLIRHWQK